MNKNDAEYRQIMKEPPRVNTAFLSILKAKPFVNSPMNLANHEFTFKQTLLLTAALLLGFLVAITFVYREITSNQIKQEFAENIENQMSARYNLIKNNMGKQEQRIKFLHLTPPIDGIVRATQNNGIDPKDGTKLEQWKARLAIIFESFIENNPDILQLRYIGAQNNGKELVRVERQGANVRIVAPERLQAKGDSDYFKEISQYHPGQLYVSDINLNREYGKIQIPLTPTQRLALPVFDKSNHFFGFIIMNLDSKVHINEYVNSIGSQLEIFILNNSGGFIYHSNPDIAFDFEINPEGMNTWQKIYTEVDASNKDKHLTKEINQLTNHILNFDSKIFFLSALNRNRTLSLIIGVDEKTTQSILNQRIQSLALILIALMALIFIIFAYYQANLHKRLSLVRDQAEFKAIVTGSLDGVISMDEFGRVTGWNEAATHITGYPEKFAIGSTIFELFLRNNDKESIKSLIHRIYYQSEVESLECSALSQKNKEIELSIHFSPIILDNGKTIGVAAILRDITEQKSIQNQILELNTSLEAKVASRTKELEAAKNLALKSNETKSEFIANVSHEIRTPMNGVIGMLELIAKDPLTAKQQHQLEMAKFSAHHLTHLVNDILDMSKIEAGKLEIDASEFNLLKFLSDISSSLAIRAQAKGLEFILDASQIQHEHAIGDAMRINQVITNLVGNALKFTQKGDITLIAKTKEKDQKIILECTIADTGKGIKKEKLKSLFDSFTQEDSSITKQFGGTGLGLTISRQLCHLMHGDIHVESDEGKGSQFSFEITLEPCPNKSQTLISTDFSQANILIASPNPRLLHALNQQLETWYCSTQSSSNFNDCIDKIKQSSDFNFIIIDEKLFSNKHECVNQLNASINADQYNKVFILETIKSTQDIPTSFASLAKPVTPISLYSSLEKELYVSNSTLNSNIKEIKPSKDESSLEGTSILLVDDNQINLEVANGILEDFGIIVTMVDSAQACFDALKHHHYDAILMDCQMPVMDGYTATRKIRNGEAGDNHKDIIIIAMTAHAMTGAKDTCVAAGMNDYVPKPVIADNLKSMLLKWIPSQSVTPASSTSTKTS